MLQRDFVRTPQGLRHKTLVRTLRGGEQIRRELSAWQVISPEHLLLATIGDVTADIQLPEPLPGDGWTSNASWQNTTGSPVSSFTSKWTVPPAPQTHSSQTIFLFNSILDANGSHILQPVLQWGGSAAPSSDDSWAIASWWVGQPKDPCFISNLVPVATGDVLTGRITLIGSANGLFNYVCEFVGQPATKLVAENLPELTVCTETLETYGITTISDYPDASSTAFTAINVETGNPLGDLAWIPDGPSPAHIVSNSSSNGEVDVIYPTA